MKKTTTNVKKSKSHPEGSVPQQPEKRLTSTKKGAKTSGAKTPSRLTRRDDDHLSRKGDASESLRTRDNYSAAATAGETRSSGSSQDDGDGEASRGVSSQGGNDFRGIGDWAATSQSTASAKSQQWPEDFR